MQQDPVDHATAYHALAELGSDAVRLVADYARDLLLLLDNRGYILWASPSHRALLGRDPDAVIGHHCGEWLHPEDRETQRAIFSERVEQRAWRAAELRVQHVDGSYIVTESLGVPITGANGAVEKVLIVARDITDRKRVEQRLRESENRLRTIVEQIPAAVWTTDERMVVTSSLGGGLAALGLKPDQLVGMKLDQAVAGNERAAPAIDVHQRTNAGESVTYETRWNGRDLYLHMQPLKDAGGNASGTIGIALDITEQKRAERRYQTLFERNLAGVFRSTIDGRLLECNDAFARMFGYRAPAEMMDVPTHRLYFHDEDRAKLIELLRKRGELVNHEVRLRRRTGEAVWTLVNAAVVADATLGDVLEGTIIDITGRKLAEARIEYQAFHDSLTDLPNRFLFNDRLALAVAQSKRHGHAVAVLFLDLDHFKLINDSMAHSAGDELLRGAAERLTSCLRSEDTVARIGGDEFVFILPEVDPAFAAASAAKVAQKVLDMIRQPFVIQGRELFVTASVGIAISPHDGTDSETLVKNADSAMYRAKDAGRNNYQFHTPLAQRRAEVRLTMETALRRAVERGEFHLVYQPQVSLRTGEVVGFEALLRWDRPGHGLIEPKSFIPLAEEVGIIVPIGEWVLWTACRQMRDWNRDDLRISINLSPRQFQHENLTRAVEEVLDETGLEPSRLELEITESLSIRDSDLTIGRLSHFRTMGISTSLDDFGTGYSSLAHLRFLPIDSVKIDRSFITDLREVGAERTIVQAIVTMAQSLKMRVVAEGVETPEQQELLRELGCDEMQGYVFRKPMSVEEVDAMLAGH